MHLGKHNHFPRLLVSKFLMSNPNNVNLEPKVKYLPCKTAYTSNQFSTVFFSDKVVKQWVLVATPSVLEFGGFF